MTTSNGSIRLQRILRCQIRRVALGQTTNGAAEEIAIVDEVDVGVDDHYFFVW